jgi:hypothetical protein
LWSLWARLEGSMRRNPRRDAFGKVLIVLLWIALAAAYIGLSGIIADDLIGDPIDLRRFRLGL